MYDLELKTFNINKLSRRKKNSNKIKAMLNNTFCPYRITDIMINKDKKTASIYANYKARKTQENMQEFLSFFDQYWHIKSAACSEHYMRVDLAI